MSNINKKIVILGSTGEIGRHALAVVDRFPETLEVIGLSCNHSSTLFQEQVAHYQPQLAVIASQNPADLEKLACLPEADLVVVAVVGVAGIIPTLAAIRAGKNIALATKEVLVIAGKLILAEARKYGVKIIPIDSEHSAIFQSLASGKTQEISQIYLTMGRGRLAELTSDQLAKVSIEDVLTNHWQMGNKITVDAATCVNKIFEVIEAAYLFSLQSDQVKIVVHPEYFCHSLVAFVDGSIIGEFGISNMDRYLQYALLYPDRLTHLEAQSSIIGKNLSFLPPDEEKFFLLQLIPLLLASSGNLPAFFHGVDRACVDAFLAGQITYINIFNIVDKLVRQCPELSPDTLKDLDLALATEAQGYQEGCTEIQKYVRK